MSRESFNHFIRNLYGEEIFKEFKNLEKISIKKVSRLCDLAFLKRCRDSNILPNFIKISHPVNTPQARKIFTKASFALLRERIKYTRISLNIMDNKIRVLQDYLFSNFTLEHWNMVMYLLTGRINRHMTHVKLRQVNKFNNLKVKNTFTTTNIIPSNKLVYNLSDFPLSSDATKVLSKGLNFGISPRSIPKEDFITGVESALHDLPSPVAAEIRYETVRIIKKAVPPKPNLTAAEFRALKDLRNNKDIIILSADKGKAAVVLNHKDYIEKAQVLLNDPAYVKLKKNPNSVSKSQTTRLLKSSGLPQEIVKKLIPQDPLIPRFYGLPKIHKQGVPLRPIVSSIGSTTYGLSKYLNTLLKPYVGNSASYIKDSKHFIALTKDIKLTDNDLLVSFDVASLFTKVPISDTLKLLERHFSPDIIPLFRHCLTQCFFLFNGDFYKQIDGVAMGSPISPAIANYYMEFFEENCLATSDFKPSIWLRYVDDIFAVWPHGKEKLDLFLKHLNNQHANISFTMELEVNGSLPFLDVLLQKSSSGSLIHSVYRKPTHTNQYINAFSHHPMFQKMSTMRNLYKRSVDICHPDKLSDEIKTLKNVFLQNGYSNYQIERAMKPRNRPNNRLEITGNSSFALLPYVANISEKIARLLVKYNIKTSFSSSGKLRHFLRSAKDAIPLHAAGIYRVPCECGQVYIGQTGRLVATRLTEHKRNIRLDQPDKSAIAEHAINTLHNVKFEDTCILVREKRLNSRLIREGIEILKHPNNFNRDAGSEISPIWLTLL